MDTELFREWFQAFAQHAGITLHVDKQEASELDDYLDRAIEIFEGMQHG